MENSARNDQSESFELSIIYHHSLNLNYRSGFLRGKQHAVCLSLIVDSIVQVGVIGCPNLLINPQSSEQRTGCIFVAVRGQGARQVKVAPASILLQIY